MARTLMSGIGMASSRIGRVFSHVPAAAIVITCVFAAHVGVVAAQDDVVMIQGRVLWIAGDRMIVAPYAIGAPPVNVDLSQASLDEYLTLKTGDSVAVTGTIAEEGDRIVATSIRGASRG